MFANWQSFLIHEKMFANGANPSRIIAFWVPILQLATPIFPAKVATVEALQSSANAVAIVDTPIYNCSIMSFLQNILTLQLNIQLEHMIVP